MTTSERINKLKGDLLELRQLTVNLNQRLRVTKNVPERLSLLTTKDNCTKQTMEVERELGSLRQTQILEQGERVSTERGTLLDIAILLDDMVQSNGFVNSEDRLDAEQLIAKLTAATPQWRSL